MIFPTRQSNFTEKGQNYDYRKESQTDSETLCLVLTGDLPGATFRRRRNEGFL
jgi:hypothetical protein